jgi:hypothetical protein
MRSHLYAPTWLLATAGCSTLSINQPPATQTDSGAAGSPLPCRLDRIIVPVHEGLHWTAIMADLANK